MNGRQQSAPLFVDLLESREMPAGIQAAYTITGDWGSGFQAMVRVMNETAAPVTFNKLEFDLPGSAAITSIWDAKVSARVGERYAVTSAGWNAVIPAGGVTAFGFVGTRGTPAPTADDFSFNGVAVGVPFLPPPVSLPPVSPPITPPTTVNPAVSSAITSDWGSGVTGLITVRNLGSTAISNWRLSFDLPGSIDSIWSASVQSKAGNRYTVMPVDWTKSIPVGGSVSFGFNASPGGIAASSFTLTPVTGPTVSPVVPPASPPTSPPVATPPAAPSSWPAEVFAPYVDATLWPYYDFVAAAAASGVRYFTLGFVQADLSNKPAWGGYASLPANGTETEIGFAGKIGALRALGGDVAVSFGGAAGRELAEVITDVNQLAAAYRSVIQAYNLTHIDFDIEGAATNHTASVTRRSQAIAILQREAAAAGRELHVRFTLPVLPSGLTADGLGVLQSAKASGVRVDLVNIMAMDYGDSAAPNPNGLMADYAIQAATSLFNQLTALWGSSTTVAQRWRMIGITPMIGMNDVQTEIFDQVEARQLTVWAEQRDIGLLSFWSMNRDYQNPAGALGYVDLKSSSLLQGPLEFSRIFNGFTG